MFDLYSQNCLTKCSTYRGNDLQTAEFHQDTWNPYIMAGFDSSPNPWNDIVNLKFPQSHNALWSELVHLTTSTLSDICQNVYSLTDHAQLRCNCHHEIQSLKDLPGAHQCTNYRFRFSLPMIWIVIGYYKKYNIHSIRLIVYFAPISKAG